MDDTISILLLVLASIALLVWGLSSIFSDATRNNHKRLQQRLAQEGRAASLEPAARVIKRDIEVAGWSAVFIKLPGMESLHRAIEQTWPKLTLARFLGIAGGIGLVAFLLAGAIFGSLLLACAASVAGGVIPFMVLSMRRSKRQRMLNEQLPEALDFLSRILRAGHSLTTGLQMVGEELPNPLAEEFRRAYNSHSLGRTLDDALKEARVRVNSTDFGFFVTAVMIQRQTGGDLAEVLDNISGMIRSRLRLQQHVMAKTAEGRFTGYILTGFPVAMFFITYAMNPPYAGVLLEGTGLYLLGTAAVMVVIGLIVIRKITKVTV
jgi:tight adherence protein B